MTVGEELADISMRYGLEMLPWQIAWVDRLMLGVDMPSQGQSGVRVEIEGVGV